MNNIIMLDTHVITWYLESDTELRPNVYDKIDDALKQGEAMISSVTLLEIAALKVKNRINIFQPTEFFLENMTNIKGLTVVNIDPKIATLSVSLPNDFHKDPADRVIVASTICNNATLITRDSKIINWAKRYGHMKVLEA